MSGLTWVAEDASRHLSAEQYWLSKARLDTNPDQRAMDLQRARAEQQAVSVDAQIMARGLTP